jgi:hypothetical protein
MVRPQSTARSMRTALHRCQVSLHPRARSRKDFLRGRVIFSAWPHAPQVVNQSRRNRCPTFLPHSAAVRLSLQVSYKISQLTAVSRGRYIFGRSLVAVSGLTTVRRQFAAFRPPVRPVRRCIAPDPCRESPLPGTCSQCAGSSQDRTSCRNSQDHSGKQRRPVLLCITRRFDLSGVVP